MTELVVKCESVNQVLKHGPNNIDFMAFESIQSSPLTWAIDTFKKLKFVATYSEEFHINSYAYDPEVVHVSYSNQWPVIDWRRATKSNYFRIENPEPEATHLERVRKELLFYRKERPNVFYSFFGDLLK